MLLHHCSTVLLTCCCCAAPAVLLTCCWPAADLQGRLVVLDLADPSPLHGSLLLPGAEELRTVYEDSLGTPLLDVNYLRLEGKGLRDRVFIA